MITSAIIDNFEVYVDDGTELSSGEELNLANKIYRQVCNYRPWEWLKKPISGSIVAGEITLPTDFNYIPSNVQSDGSKGIYLGSNLDYCPMVSFSERRGRKDNVCYIDPSDSKIKFIITPTETTYEMDYIKVPADLTLATSPIFPSQFHDIIYHGMATDDYMIQQFDKARSYKNENEAKYTSILKDMSYANAMLNSN
jgi:hypothetical protein